MELERVPFRYRPGGLFRCCFAFLALSSAGKEPQDGEEKTCDRCGTELVYHDDCWQWKGPNPHAG